MFNDCDLIVIVDVFLVCGLFEIINILVGGGICVFYIIIVNVFYLVEVNV